jgi:pimeloyl-ACP methyl ester carboxylesterase
VELSCPPEREAAMLIPVFQVMENRYPGREFGRLKEVRARVLVASGGDGNSVFAPMATVAARVVPGARLHVPDGATHFWPHERPDQLAALVRSFTRD